jgi:hypothetical protein
MICACGCGALLPEGGAWNRSYAFTSCKRKVKNEVRRERSNPGGARKAGTQPKSVAVYELEARWNGECLIHPSKHAARKVYIKRHGHLPSNIAVCHTCDQPNCILDAHHFAGTWGDNVRDAVKKGRHSCFRKGGIRFGGPHTDEARAKISAAAKRMWEARRAG